MIECSLFYSFLIIIKSAGLPKFCILHSAFCILIIASQTLQFRITHYEFRIIIPASCFPEQSESLNAIFLFLSLHFKKFFFRHRLIFKIHCLPPHNNYFTFKNRLKTIILNTRFFVNLFCQNMRGLRVFSLFPLQNTPNHQPYLFSVSQELHH